MKKVLVSGLVFAMALVLVGCGKKGWSDNVQVANGDKVTVWYVGTLEDGTVFDTNDKDAAKAKNVYSAEFDKCEGEDLSQCKYKPLEFTVGAGQMIPGFEKAVMEMKKGDKKSIELQPDEAYGQPQPELVQTVPADVFSGSGINPEVGQTYNFGFAPGKIVDIKDNSITIDFNPPLAGKKLKFDITIVDVVKGTGAVDAWAMWAPTPTPSAPVEEDQAAPAADAATWAAMTGN